MKSRRSVLGVVVAAVVGAFALLNPGKALAQDRPGALVGVVVNEDRKPVVGAIVVLKRGDRVIGEVRSNDAGRFEFPKLRPGKYLVEAGKRDVGRGRARVEVASGEMTHARVVLHKP